MLKISFFPPDVIKDYENKVANVVKERNDDNDYIIFIPPKITNPKTGKPYKISISDLLTLDREHILEIDGIKLYMYICSAQKYKSMSNAKLLNSLYSEYPSKVTKIEHKYGCYEYEINKIFFSTKRIDDKNGHPIIDEAARLIRDEFAKYNTNYANKYFYKRKIKCINDLKDILDKMADDLMQTLYVNNNPTPIIDYSIITGDLRHKLMNSIGIRTCPYCNRNYITRYGVKGSKSTADLDHFYQKEQFPLFALSLFNFVPSCPICNSRMKNIHPADDTLYPYEEGFGDDVHFELKYIGKENTEENILHLWQALKDINYNDFNIEIVINPKTSSDRRKRIEKSKDLFRLEEVYEDHKQEALETSIRSRIYCEGSYKKFCEKLFEKCKDSGMIYSSASDLESYMFRAGFDEEWLMFGIFMNDEKRRYDKPLSRMIYDIYHSTK